MILTVSEIKSQPNECHVVTGAIHADIEGVGKLMGLVGKKMIIPFWWDGGQLLMSGRFKEVSYSVYSQLNTISATVIIVDPEIV